MNAKKYNNIKLAIGIAKAVLSFLLILLFVVMGFSVRVESALQNYFVNEYLRFLIFSITLSASLGIFLFPFSFYSEFYLEHKYNLSNQTFLKWLWEGMKGMFVGAAIGLPVLLFFFFVLNYFGSLWWLPFAIFLFLISVVLSQIVPIFILPLFYKIVPVESEELRSRIETLAASSSMKVENVYTFDMSKNTKKANAAFTGLGKTKRILLGDTLVNNYSLDEIETVIAHELGHYKKKHIVKNLIIGTATSFLTLYLLAVLYDASLSFLGFSSRTEIAALPLLSLWMMLISLVQTPLTNILSRKYEYEADQYAVELSQKPEAFISSLEKLTEQNLGDKNPHPAVEWFFYSHPSIDRRIEKITTHIKKFEHTNFELSGAHS